MGNRRQLYTELRNQAEKILKERAGEGGGKPSDADLLNLFQELEIHQVELDLQNEELRRAQKELEDSRNQYYDLYDTAPVGFVTIDRKGLVSRVNRAAEEMFADSDRTFLGEVFSRRIYPEDYKLFRSILKEAADSAGRKACEVRMTGKDGTLFYVRLEAGALFDQSARPSEWRLALSDITGRKKIEEELELRVQERTAQLSQRAKQLSRLTSELTLAEQRERRRLAETLHDNLQQVLVSAKMSLEVLANRMIHKQKEEAEKIVDLIKNSIQISRSLTAELSPPVLYQGGVSAALEWLSRWMRDHHGFNVELEIDPRLDPQREDLKVILFQSVRELLFNAVKHSGVKSARVEMRSDGHNRLRVAVLDQGIGFDPDILWKKEKEGAGFGLFSIRERLALMGGNLEIESAPGRGACFSMVIPLQTAGNEDEKKIRVLLADDHSVVRRGLTSFFGSHSNIEIVGEASDGEAAVSMARELQPDVILMDISMPRMNGLEATRIIHSEFPRIRIIGLSMNTGDTVNEMIEAGACAYLGKSGDTEVLISAIRGEAGFSSQQKA